MTHTIEIENAHLVHAIINVQEAMATLAEGIEENGYIVPELLERALEVDVQNDDKNTLYNLIEYVMSTGDLGNDFESELITAEQFEELVGMHLAEHGAQSLVIALRDVSSVSDDIYMYDSLEHFYNASYVDIMQELSMIFELIEENLMSEWATDYEVNA